MWRLVLHTCRQEHRSFGSIFTKLLKVNWLHLTLFRWQNLIQTYTMLFSFCLYFNLFRSSFVINNTRVTTFCNSIYVSNLLILYCFYVHVTLPVEFTAATNISIIFSLLWYLISYVDHHALFSIKIDMHDFILSESECFGWFSSNIYMMNNIFCSITLY